MARFLLLTIIAVASAAKFAVNKDVCHGGSKEFNPGYTFIEKNGQYVKFIGKFSQWWTLHNFFFGWGGRKYYRRKELSFKRYLNPYNFPY